MIKLMIKINDKKQNAFLTELMIKKINDKKQNAFLTESR